MKWKIVFWMQVVWMFLASGPAYLLSKMITKSFWLSLPLGVLFWAILTWVGMALLSLLSPDHRLAAKLGIKVENLPIYRQAFEKLVEAEERGEDTKWIGDTLPDEQEWMTYLAYEIDKELKARPKTTKPI